ncbi:MAG: carbohydrate ABC transporter permease, partial [Beijerinckiaceae bacterium]
MTRARLLPYLLIAPATVFLLALFVVPLVQTIALAFTDNGVASLTNFRKMVDDLNFGLSIRNTFLLVLAVIPLQLCLALIMAMMVQKLEKGRDIVLWILIIPLGISDLAAGLVWLTI